MNTDISKRSININIATDATTFRESAVVQINFININSNNGDGFRTTVEANDT